MSRRTAEVFSAGVSRDRRGLRDRAGRRVVHELLPGGAEDLEGERQVDLPLPFRVRIKLVKIDGEWLVDDFTPLTGEDETPAPAPARGHPVRGGDP